jgi:integrase
VFRPKYKDKRTGELREASTWSIRYYVRGKMRQEQTHSTKKPDAERLLRARVTAAAQGRPAGPDVEKTTVKDLIEILVTDYKNNGRRSLRRLSSSVGHLSAFFGEYLAVDVTEDRIAAYVRQRKEEINPRTHKSIENATVNRELAALKRMFRLGERAQRVGRRPYIEMLKETNTRKGFFEYDQLQAVLCNLSVDLQPLAQVAYITGWRVADELQTRQWSHVDFEAGFLRLEPGETKNDEGRMFPLTPGLREVLEEQRERTKTLEVATGRIIPWVFHRNGKPIRDLRTAWRDACEKAGVPGRVLHDFRRTAVRNLERAGVPRSTAMKMVGHKTEAIYRRYAIVDEGMMREGAEKLATLHAAERTIERKHAAAGGRFIGPDKSGTSRGLNATEVEKG